jgi:hypothetical protein
MGVDVIRWVRPTRPIDFIARTWLSPGWAIRKSQLEVKMTRIRTVPIANCCDLFSPRNIAACPQERLHVAIKSLNLRSVRKLMSNDEDVSPPCSSIRSVDYGSLGSGVDR